tara:strand:- start:352 stop:582 length:231 start_codon:yes stop_codon:yes gene_type:complete
MEFKRNKDYFSLLNRESETRWVCENPLFLCGDKGLFPVYRANGRQGVLNKNYHELILKDLKEEKCQKKTTKLLRGL